MRTALTGHGRGLTRTVLALLAQAAVGVPLHAQLTVALTGGTVRYENVTTNSSMSVSPDLLLTHPYLFFDATANASDGTGGTRVIQGGSTLWGATPPLGRFLQFTGLVQAQGTKPEGDVWSSAGQAFGEIAFARPGRGVAVGAGGARGQLQGQPAVTALRTGARAWTTAGPAWVALSVQPTRMSDTSGGAWFTDVGGRVQLMRGAWILVGDGTVRQGTGLTTSAGMDAAAFWRSPRGYSFEASGGRYLRDPYQALPAGWYLTAGVRLTLWTPRSGGLRSNVSQATLSTVGVGSQAGAGFQGSSSTRSVPGVTKPTASGGSTNTGRGHRP